MDATGAQELLRLQRRAIKLRGMPAEGTVPSPEQLADLDLIFQESGDEGPPAPHWLLKYLPHPPTLLQDWADWLLLAEGLTALEGLLQRDRPHPATLIDPALWRPASGFLNLGEWIRAALAAGIVTIGSVPMNAVHASTRKVSDGYLIVVKQGLLRFVQELVTIYELAERKPGSDKITRRLQRLLDTHAQQAPAAPSTWLPVEFAISSAIERIVAMMIGLHLDEYQEQRLESMGLLRKRRRSVADRRRPNARPRTPRGLSRNILASLFVVLHELAHVYHGDADISVAEAARLETEYDEAVERARQEGEVVGTLGSPGAQRERWADAEALDALMEVQRSVRIPNAHPLAAFSPDVNIDLQTTALESAFLATIALNLVHSTTPTEPQAVATHPSRQHDPYGRLQVLSGHAKYEATMSVEVIDAVNQMLDERLGPAIRHVLSHL